MFHLGKTLNKKLYMKQQALKWWKPLSIKDKEKIIKEWKNSAGIKEDNQFKEWPDNLIMLSTFIIEKMFVYNNIKNKK